MNRAFTVRIIIDLAIIILLLCAYAYRIIGDTAHEWVGVSVFVLLIAHNVINYRWYKNIGKGTYTIQRVIMTTINALLALTMSTLVITGLVQSRSILSFLNLTGGMVLRQIHTTAAYWGLPLIGVHIGLHWGMFTRFIGNHRLIIYIMRILAFLFAAFGVWSSFDRDMFSKLFLGFSFDYWSTERPIILFFAETISIIGIYVFTVYHLMKLIAWLKTGNKK